MAIQAGRIRVLTDVEPRPGAYEPAALPPIAPCLCGAASYLVAVQDGDGVAVLLPSFFSVGEDARWRFRRGGSGY
jgi:hypothetical protein